MISALTESKDPSDYWTTLKKRLSKEEGSELPINCRKLKFKAKDGKMRNTDTLDTKGIFRLIESVPSPKAEPFKLWLANLGSEKVDEVFDPSKGIDQMIDFYLKKGYTLKWIEARIKAILNRKKLTNAWKDSKISENYEYAILTNSIYKEWSGMSANEYKKFKGIRKENLRDNMTDIEILLTDLGEMTTRDIVKEENPQGFSENMKAAKRGGRVANDARKSYERATNKSVISSQNALKYHYQEIDKLENK